MSLLSLPSLPSLPSSLVLADTPFGIAEPTALLVRALVALVCTLALLVTGIRLVVLFRQVTLADWRRWVAYIPLVLSVPALILAIITYLAYRGVAHTQAQISALDYNGLLAWEGNVSTVSNALNPWNTALFFVTLAVLAALVLYLVLTPPRRDEGGEE